MKARGLIRWIAPLALLLLLLSPLATWAQTGGLPALPARTAGGVGAGRGSAGTDQYPRCRWQPDLYALHPDAAHTHGADLHSSRAADDDQFYPHHHRAIFASTRAGHSNVTPESGAGWPRALLDVFYHVTGAGQGLR